MLQYRPYLRQGNPRKQLDKFSNGHTVFKVFKKDRHGNPGSVKKPSATHTFGVALYFTATRPVNHDLNISTKVIGLPLLVCGVGQCLPPTRGDRAMRVRFWGESTREKEKLVRLSSRNFFSCATASPHAFHPKARSHYPITALGSFMVGDPEPGQDRTTSQ